MMVLVGVVVSSAISSLPLRGLFVYNAFAEEPYTDLWFLLFAKTIVYLSCALNPFLYNIRNRRFRVAVRHLFRPAAWCARGRGKRRWTPDNSSFNHAGAGAGGSVIWDRERVSPRML